MNTGIKFDWLAPKTIGKTYFCSENRCLCATVNWPFYPTLLHYCNYKIRITHPLLGATSCNILLLAGRSKFTYFISDCLNCCTAIVPLRYVQDVCAKYRKILGPPKSEPQTNTHSIFKVYDSGEVRPLLIITQSTLCHIWRYTNNFGTGLGQCRSRAWAWSC